MELSEAEARGLGEFVNKFAKSIVPNLEEVFHAGDTNGDFVVSRAEMQSKLPAITGCSAE